MTLRPRYSLLTLLILTALIAGGVKLWHGPHHVVEREKPYAEVEYTFTRSWRGDRIIQGVCIKRYEQPPGTPEHVMLLYYRQGLHLHRTRYIYLNTPAKTYAPAITTEGDEPLELTPREQAELDRTVQQEYQRLQANGYTLKTKATN